MSDTQKQCAKFTLVNKMLWLGYSSAEQGIDKRKKAVYEAQTLLDEYLEQYK
jgi:hypothetical protein